MRLAAFLVPTVGLSGFALWFFTGRMPAMAVAATGVVLALIFGRGRAWSLPEALLVALGCRRSWSRPRSRGLSWTALSTAAKSDPGVGSRWVNAQDLTPETRAFFGRLVGWTYLATGLDT
jgi:hypothetical protein